MVNALAKRVTDGTETEICKFADERPVHDGGAVRKFRHLAQDGSQVEGAIRGPRDGRTRGLEPGPEDGDEQDRRSGGAADCGRKAVTSDVGAEEDPASARSEARSGSFTGRKHGGRGSQAARAGEGAQAARRPLHGGTRDADAAGTL